MSKLGVISSIVIVTSLIGLYLLLSLQGGALAITDGSRACVADTDCVLYSPDCEDCKLEAVATSSRTELVTNKEKHCREHPPKYQCDLAPRGVPKCINKMCTIAQ